MTENVDVERLILETRQYEFADGLREIQYGILLAAIGFITWLGINPTWLGWVMRLMKNVGDWAIWAAFIFVWLIPIAAAFVTLRLIQIARRRWLWRNTGMVKASSRVISRWTQVLAALTMVAGLVLGFLFAPLGVADEWYAARLLYAAVGWGSGVFFIAFSRDIGLPRYLWIGIIGGLASTLLLLYPFAFGEAGLAFGVGWGMLLVGGGLVALRRVGKKAQMDGSDG
jgi:hypothetical protein